MVGRLARSALTNHESARLRIELAPVRVGQSLLKLNCRYATTSVGVHGYEPTVYLRTNPRGAARGSTRSLGRVTSRLLVPSWLLLVPSRLLVTSWSLLVTSWLLLVPSRLLVPSWLLLVPSWLLLVPSWLLLITSWLLLVPSWLLLVPSWSLLVPSLRVTLLRGLLSSVRHESSKDREKDDRLWAFPGER